MALVPQIFDVGQVVFAKIKGYPPWPAIITYLPTKTKARVLYFNSGKTNDLSFEKLTPFHAGKYIEEKYRNRNVGFTKAFEEMLLIMQVSEKKNKTTKKKEKNNRNVRRLMPTELKRIQSDLKPKKKEVTREAKSRLRSGRLY